MFRRIRIAVLLSILVVVVLSTWTDRLNTTRWTAPMTVALFPIDADGRDATERYIDDLSVDDFTVVERFLQDESAEYGIKLDRPVRFTLAPQLDAMPPARPEHPTTLQVMWWSLRLRWWAWRVPPKPPGPTPRIRLFLAYYDPERTRVLDHSTGLQKGLIGVVQLFADRREHGPNTVVLAHEFLHTLGATDKYDLATTLPSYPQGFAEPDREPRYPQRYAELMAGRIPVSPQKATIPASLAQVVIGPATAKEIGWLKD